MKKIALCSLLVGLVPCLSFADCTPKSMCGAKTAAKWAGGITLGTSGALVGSTAGVLLGPVGVIGGAVAGGYFAGKAGAQIGWDASYNADEYIYFSDKTCLECDVVQLYNSGECLNDTWVSNGNKVFRCDAPKSVVDIKNLSLDVHVSDDKWVDETGNIGICSDSPVKTTSADKIYEISLKGNNEKVINVPDGIVVVYDGKPCVYIKEKISEPEPTPEPEQRKSCKQSRSTVEGRACCDIPSNEAKWENNQCKCLNGKEFKIVNGKGQCVGTNTTPVETCKYTFTSKIKCWDGSTFTEKTELELDKSLFKDGKCIDETVPDFETWFDAQADAVKQAVLSKCPKKPVVQTPEPSKPTFDSAKLNAATSAMSDFFSSAESNRSGLRTADGKFNTVRLASDITAGVVLGTVGGVVSGVVIKKKQVEKGFEALHCTVGGQKIADWGDEFSVGLQR